MLVYPDGTRIEHFRQPQLPQLRWEWHPQKKTVYVIYAGATPEIGQPIAMDIDNHGAAWNAVLIFVRGYKTAKAELLQKEAA